MSERLQELRRKRLVVILASLAYFAALLAVGVLVFLRGTAFGWLLVLVCAAAYLLLVRPILVRYQSALRGAILAGSVGRRLSGYRHDPSSGVSQERLASTGLVPRPLRAMHSREHIQGRAGSMPAELADVTFPIRENGRNAMFSGCYLGLTCPGADFAPLRVEAGDLQDLRLPKQQREALEALGALIPGSLYLSMEGERLDILLRGRFLGFPVNPLLPVTEKSLSADPMPELAEAIRLAQLCRREHK